MFRPLPRGIRADVGGHLGEGDAGNRRDIAAGLGHPAQNFLPEMLDQGCRVRFSHLRQADDDGFPCLDEEVQELRRNLVVVAFVGGDVDDDVGKGDDFHQAGDVAGRGPGRHVRAIPDDEIGEGVGCAVGGGRDPLRLVDVLVEVSGLRLGKSGERSEESEVGGPGDAEGGGEEGGGVSGVAGLRVGLGNDGTAEEVDDSTFPGPGPADDGHKERAGCLPLRGGSDDVPRQGCRQPQVSRVHRQIRLSTAVVFQPGQIIRELSDFIAVVVRVHIVHFSKIGA